MLNALACVILAGSCLQYRMWSFCVCSKKYMDQANTAVRFIYIDAVKQCGFRTFSVPFGKGKKKPWLQGLIKYWNSEPATSPILYRRAISMKGQLLMPKIPCVLSPLFDSELSLYSWGYSLSLSRRSVVSKKQSFYSFILYHKCRIQPRNFGAASWLPRSAAGYFCASQFKLVACINLLLK